MNRLTRNVIMATTIISMVFAGKAQSQYDAQASQYMFLPEAFNPATVAANERYNAVGLYRMQWAGMDGGPKSMFFAVSAPVTLLKQKHGIGVIFKDDEAGAFSTQAVTLQYAFKYKLKYGVLKLGTDIGFMNQSISSDSLNLLDGTDEYHHASDVAIPTTSANAMAFDVGVGATFQAEDFYVGFSTTHLTNPTFDIDERVTTSVGIASYLTGGYTYTLPNPRYTLNTDIMYKTDYHDWQLDLDVRVEQDEQWYLGAGWRIQSALVLFGGLNIYNGLSIGYSFDLSTTKLITGNYGSHELFLRYSFLLGKKKANKYKSVRIL